MKIEYRKYEFVNPGYINRQDVLFFKENFRTNNKWRPDFWKDSVLQKYWKQMTYVFIAGCIGMLLSVIGLEVKSGTIEGIGGIIWLLVFGSLFRLFPEWASYSKFLSDRKKYYKTIFKRIKKVDSFEEYDAKWHYQYSEFD